MIARFTKVMKLRAGEWVHDGTYNLTNDAGQFVNVSRHVLEQLTHYLAEEGRLWHPPAPAKPLRGFTVEPAPPTCTVSTKCKVFGYKVFEIDLPLLRTMRDEFPMPY